jgi:hypothetical protein
MMLYQILAVCRCVGCIGFIDLLFDRSRAAFELEVEAKLELKRELKETIGNFKPGWSHHFFSKIDHDGSGDIINAGELWQLFELCGILTPVAVCKKIIHQINRASPGLRKKIANQDGFGTVCRGLIVQSINSKVYQ